MKKAPSLGLLCAGSVSRTGLSRLAGLHDRLGPVKAPTRPAASRAANNLKAGYPVESFEQLAEARQILIRVPDDQLESHCRDLLEARENWTGRRIFLWSSLHGSHSLKAFRERGAFVVSFDALTGVTNSQFLAEGDAPAVRSLRELLGKDAKGLIEIADGSRPKFIAALTALSSLHLPLVAAAVELLRQCNLSPGFVAELSETQLSRSARSFLRSGKRGVPMEMLERAAHDAEVPVEDPVALASYQSQLSLTQSWLRSLTTSPEGDPA
jgi:hypothetical protein